MKAKQFFLGTLILSGVYNARSQGTLSFIYDQQSATATTLSEGGPSNIQTAQPVGQSFTPSLAAVGFVQFYLYDSSPANNLAASISIALRADSITGPILGQTDPLALPAGFSGYSDFFFSTPVSITPGTTYYLQPILVSGNRGIGGEFVSDYPGGTEFFQGSPVQGHDLWFREGIVAPEPSVWSLLLVSGGALAFGWRRR